MYSLWQDLSVGNNFFLLVTLTLTFDLLLKKRNLDHNFWTKRDRALILHIPIPCDKTFLLIPIFFDLVALTLTLTRCKCSIETTRNSVKIKLTKCHCDIQDAFSGRPLYSVHHFSYLTNKQVQSTMALAGNTFDLRDGIVPLERSCQKVDKCQVWMFYPPWILHKMWSTLKFLWRFDERLIQSLLASREMESVYIYVRNGIRGHLVFDLSVSICLWQKL